MGLSMARQSKHLTILFQNEATFPKKIRVAAFIIRFQATLLAKQHFFKPSIIAVMMNPKRRACSNCFHRLVPFYNRSLLKIKRLPSQWPKALKCQICDDSHNVGFFKHQLRFRSIILITCKTLDIFHITHAS